MPIKVLLADDSDSMRSVIRSTLQKEPRIEVVGEASSFGKTVQMITDFKPDVLVMDVYFAEKRDFAPSLVKSLLVGVRSVVAVSSSNDDDAKILARSYGAYALLHKMSLVHHLVPTILQCSVVHTSSKSWAASA